MASSDDILPSIFSLRLDFGGRELLADDWDRHLAMTTSEEPTAIRCVLLEWVRTAPTASAKG
jgi:hypothetical protein